MFGEVTWFYPGSGSASNNRSVTYNYMDSSPERPVWTTSSLARSTWSDSHIFGKPHATSMIQVQQVIQRWVIPMVVQHTMNMKQATIKLKLEQQQRLQQYTIRRF